MVGLVQEGALNTDDPLGPPGSVVSGVPLVWQRAWSRPPLLGWVSGLAGSGRPGRGDGGGRSQSRAGPESLFCRCSRGTKASAPPPGPRRGDDAPPARVWFRPRAAPERPGVAAGLGPSPRVAKVLPAHAPHTLVDPFLL